MTHWNTGNPRILLGNLPGGNDPWRGVLLTLLIQNTFLGMDESPEDLISMVGDSNPRPGTVLLYSLEKSDDPLLDRSGNDNNLIIPDRFIPEKDACSNSHLRNFVLTVQEYPISVCILSVLFPWGISSVLACCFYGHVPEDGSRSWSF